MTDFWQHGSITVLKKVNYLHAVVLSLDRASDSRFKKDLSAIGTPKSRRWKLLLIRFAVG
jgi:hypothetical protein